MFLLRFLWRYKIGAIGGIIYSIAALGLFIPYLGCAFYGEGWLCGSRLDDFLDSSELLSNIAGSLGFLYAFLLIPTRIEIHDFFGSVLGTIYAMFLGGIVEFVLRKLAKIYFKLYLKMLQRNP